MKDIMKVYHVPQSKIHMIYNGVDTEFWNPQNVSESEIFTRRNAHWRTDRYVVLYYGHAGKSKGLDYLVEAMPEIHKTNKNILFAFNLIDSKRTSYMKMKIMQTAVLNDIPIANVFAGHKEGKKESIQIFSWFDQKQLRTLVASADLIVAPSLSEWFWSVHTETVALGKPLLTTTVWPIPEVVWGQVKMIPPKSTEQIVEGILSFAGGQSVQSIPVKNFSREKTVEEIEKLYR